MIHLFSHIIPTGLIYFHGNFPLIHLFLPVIFPTFFVSSDFSSYISHVNWHATFDSFISESSAHHLIFIYIHIFSIFFPYALFSYVSFFQESFIFTIHLYTHAIFFFFTMIPLFSHMIFHT